MSDTKEGTVMFTRRRLLACATATLIGALAMTNAQAQGASTTTMANEQGKEGIVKMSDSSIQFFSRGQGEAIVLLPGGTLTVCYLDGLAEAFAKAGYRGVSINFRGSGKNTGPARASRSTPLPTMWQASSGTLAASRRLDHPLDCTRLARSAHRQTTKQATTEN
jgi:predicted alpha/beta-fold hydrolase